MKGEWAVPIALALVTAGLAHLYLPDDPQRLFTVAEPDTVLEGPYVLLPAAGSHGPSTLLRYDAAPRHGIGDFLDLHAGASNGTHWTWNGRDAVCLRGGDCTPQGAMDVRLDDDARLPDAAPVTGEDTAATATPGNHTPGKPAASTEEPGTDTLRVTFFLFDGAGFLLATNTPRTTWSAFDLHGDFSYVPDQVWHIGSGPAPDGARKVPAYRDTVRGLLDGATVGSVHSGVLVQHEYEWYLGPVWLTVRVEGITPAEEAPAAP